MNCVIPRCGGLHKLESGLPPELRPCAPKMWAAVEGVLSAALDEEMDGLRFRLSVTRRALLSRAGNLVVAGLPGMAPTAHVTIEFKFADDGGRSVVLFVPRAAALPPRAPRLTRLRPGGAPPDVCQTCEARDGLLACPGCRAVWYCGPECQAADWGAHESVCDAIHKLG